MSLTVTPTYWLEFPDHGSGRGLRQSQQASWVEETGWESRETKVVEFIWQSTKGERGTQRKKPGDLLNTLGQRSPIFLAPGTGFVEDNFSWGVWDGSGSKASNGEWQTKLLSPAAHLLPCGPVPNRLRTGTRLRPGGWGPLLQGIPRVFSRVLTSMCVLMGTVRKLHKTGQRIFWKIRE